MKTFTWFWFELLATGCTALAHAQTASDTLNTLQQHALKIYVDCNYCDLDYIRTEITFVNYVRDRKEAQVHALITTQETGGGGTEYTLTLIGQLNFAGQNDTLKYVSKQTDTEDLIRKGLVRVLQIGLVRYAAKTPLADYLTVSYSKPSAATQARDKWNYWVFSINTNGYLNEEKSTKFVSLYGSLSANRVTSALKINLQLYGNYNESSFDIDDATFTSFSRSKGWYGLIVKSLSEHWSAGVSNQIFSSTFSNLKLRFNAAPALEYNLFPYSESTRRQLRFLYRTGYSLTRYEETTIYDKDSESLLNESLSIALESKQTWGSIEASLQGSHYLHDFSKNHVQLFSELSLQLFKGMSFEVYGSVSLIHDQLSLPKGGATTEEILLQRKQLATQYSYFASIGLSYTFGSIYNNVVNPRFGN